MLRFFQLWVVVRKIGFENCPIAERNIFRHRCNPSEGRSLKERRKRKDRRKTIDPRYRNPAYPNFVDRRKYDRRKWDGDGVTCVVSEHPDSRLVMSIGIMTVIFVLSVFFLSTLNVEKVAEVKRAGSVFCDTVLPYILPWSF